MRLTKLGRTLVTASASALGLLAVQHSSNPAKPVAQLCWVAFCSVNAVMLHIRAEKRKTLPKLYALATLLTPLLFAGAAVITTSFGAVGLAALILGAGILAATLTIAFLRND